MPADRDVVARASLQRALLVIVWEDRHGTPMFVAFYGGS